MNNILIYDAVSGEEKGEYQFSGYTFKRDITQRSISELSIYDPEGKVKALDYFFIPIFINEKLNLQISGFVNEVENEQNNYVVKLKLVYGADTFNPSEVYIPGNSQDEFNITETNGSDYTLKFITEDVLVATDEILDLDTLIRQGMRKSPKSEIFTQNSCTITDDVEHIIYNIRADDPAFKNFSATFADDKFNKFTVYLNEDKTQTITGYLIDGVYTNVMDPNIIYTATYETVGLESFTETYVENKLKSQEYNNEIKFNILLDNEHLALKFDNTFLGRKIKIYFDNGNTLDTIISKYEIKNTLEIAVTMGLTRSRLTEFLNKDKEEL